MDYVVCYLFVFLYVSSLLGVLVNSKRGFTSKSSSNKIFLNKWLAKYDRYRGIIKNHTEITNEDNLTPEIKLHLITPTCTLWTADTRSSPFKAIPYFGFYWAGGQGLSRYILDNPSIVKGLRVLDLGSGCGATAIAAVKAGAKSVTANDIDPIACVAIDLNAKLNNASIRVTKKNLIGKPTDRYDCIVLGDLLYDPDVVNAMVPWLSKFCDEGNKTVYIGDPGRFYVPALKKKKHIQRVAMYHLSTITSYLNIGYKMTKVFRFYSKKPRRVKPKQIKRQLRKLGLLTRAPKKRKAYYYSKEDFWGVYANQSRVAVPVLGEN